jgi:hypothetical protein
MDCELGNGAIEQQQIPTVCSKSNTTLKNFHFFPAYSTWPGNLVSITAATTLHWWTEVRLGPGRQAWPDPTEIAQGGLGPPYVPERSPVGRLLAQLSRNPIMFGAGPNLEKVEPPHATGAYQCAISEFVPAVRLYLAGRAGDDARPLRPLLSPLMPRTPPGSMRCPSSSRRRHSSRSSKSVAGRYLSASTCLRPAGSCRPSSNSPGASRTIEAGNRQLLPRARHDDRSTSGTCLRAHRRRFGRRAQSTGNAGDRIHQRSAGEIG